MAVNRQFGQALTGMVEGMKYFVETGEEVTAKTKLGAVDFSDATK